MNPTLFTIEIILHDQERTEKEKEQAFIEETEELFENFLLKVFNFIEVVYGLDMNLKQISENIILQLTYSDDDKSFKERIKQYYSEYRKREDESIFINHMKKLYRTQGKHIFYQELDKEVAPICRKVEIIPGDGPDCEDFAGVYFVSDNLYELPPYHPQCECIAIFTQPIINDQDEIEEVVTGEA